MTLFLNVLKSNLRNNIASSIRKNGNKKLTFLLVCKINPNHLQQFLFIYFLQNKDKYTTCMQYLYLVLKFTRSGTLSLISSLFIFISTVPSYERSINKCFSPLTLLQVIFFMSVDTLCRFSCNHPTRSSSVEVPCNFRLIR